MTKKWLLTLLVCGVYLMHQDFWNWNRWEPLWFGFLPPALTYHVTYSLVAVATMAILVKFAWPRNLEDSVAAELSEEPKH